MKKGIVTGREKREASELRHLDIEEEDRGAPLGKRKDSVTGGCPESSEPLAIYLTQVLQRIHYLSCEANEGAERLATAKNRITWTGEGPYDWRR